MYLIFFQKSLKKEWSKKGERKIGIHFTGLSARLNIIQFILKGPIPSLKILRKDEEPKIDNP